MGFAQLARQLPARAAAGGFILNSGLSKWHGDEESATQMHAMAASTYPFLAKVPARDFGRLLALTEITLGAALLLPVVPAWLAGAALSAFSGGTLGLYLKTEGMRQPGSVRPTPQGVPLAKDIWMLGIGLSLLADDLTERDAACGAQAER